MTSKKTKNIFFVSDTHFGHANILNFKSADGKPVRTFASVEEMDETMVDNWNRVVSQGDTVYHLGDVVINAKFLPVLSRLNGRKVLIKGNHDIFDIKEYLKYFADVRAYRVFPEHNLIASHIPIHPSQLEYRFKHNVHGHLHTEVVKTFSEEPMPYQIDEQTGETYCQFVEIPDKRYINVSVEQINYTPVSLEYILGLT